MSENWIRSSTRHRAGTTLVEVLAALVLTGSLLVALVLAKSRHERQWDTAQRRLAAVRAADQLLAGWWAEPGSMPLSGTGVVEDQPQLLWRTSLVSNTPVEQLGARVLQLELLAADGRVHEPPLAMVELVVPGQNKERP
jgi:hypothetical protein